MLSDKERYGYVKIEMAHMLKESELSKSKFRHRAELQNQQYNNYYKGTIQMVDLAVLARICHTLNCTICDLLQYVPPQEYQNREKRVHYGNR